jgi:integrase
MASMAKRGNGEGSIYFQASRDRWAGAVTLENGKRKVLYGKTRQEVARKLAAALRDIDQGLPIPGGRLTVGRFLTEWLEQAARPTLKPSTYLSYAELIRLHIVPALGARPLVKLTPQHVQAFQNERQAAGYSPRRVQMMHDVLRTALNRAMKWQLVSRNVAALVDAPRMPAADIHPLSPADAARFLDAARDGRYEHLFAPLLTSGLRLGEALALRWKSDIDLEHDRAITVRHTLEWLPRQPWRLAEPKAASARRRVPLIAPSIAALRAQRGRQLEERLRAPAWEDHDLVFTNEIGQPVRQRAVHKAFKDLLIAAGLPHSHRPHDLRHSMATYLVAAGVPERVVMEILGHSTLAMTQRYSHVLSPMVQDAAIKLEALWAGAANPQ